MKGGDTMANFQPLSFSNIQMPQFKSAAREILEAQESENASEFYKRLMHYIKEFDTSLDQEHEVGVRLVNFGQTIQFAVHNIGYYNPKLISFYGELEDGSQVQLVQHVNQISFLLLSVKRKNPEHPKRQIGFERDKQTTQEVNQACGQSAATKE